MCDEVGEEGSRVKMGEETTEEEREVSPESAHPALMRRISVGFISSLCWIDFTLTVDVIRRSV